MKRFQIVILTIMLASLSERSRVRIPLGPPICRVVLYDAAFFMPKKLWQTVPGSEP